MVQSNNTTYRMNVNKFTLKPNIQAATTCMLNNVNTLFAHIPYLYMYLYS